MRLGTAIEIPGEVPVEHRWVGLAWEIRPPHTEESGWGGVYCSLMWFHFGTFWPISVLKTSKQA